MSKDGQSHSLAYSNFNSSLKNPILTDYNISHMFELLIDVYKKAESRKEISERDLWFHQFTTVLHEIWNKLDLPPKTFTYNNDLWFYVSKSETKTNIITRDLRQIVEEDVIRYLYSLYR